MVRIVEGEIGHESKRAEFLSIKSRSVRLANILDKGNSARLQFVYQILTEGVVPQHVRQKDRFSLGCYLVNDLRVIHSQGAPINIDKNRFEAALNNGSDIRYPGQRRNDDLPQTV